MMRRPDVRKDLKVALIVGGVLLLANALFYIFLVSPRMRAWRDLEGEKAKFDNELAQARKMHDTLANYRDKLEHTEANMSTFYKDVLGSKQERSVEIQREISDIAAQFRVSPESVSYSNSDREDDGLERFEIDLPVAGDYNDLRQFLARIESSKLFLIVDSISFAGTKEGGLQLSVNIGLSTYFNAPWLRELKKQQGVEGKRKRA